MLFFLLILLFLLLPNFSFFLSSNWNSLHFDSIHKNKLVWLCLGWPRPRPRPFQSEHISQNFMLSIRVVLSFAVAAQAAAHGLFFVCHIAFCSQKESESKKNKTWSTTVVIVRQQLYLKSLILDDHTQRSSCFSSNIFSCRSSNPFVFGFHSFIQAAISFAHNNTKDEEKIALEQTQKNRF